MAKSQVFRFKELSTGPDENSDWISIGKVLNAIALEGWLRINLQTDFPERFHAGARVFVLRKQSKTPEPCVIAEVREHYSDVMLELRFEGIEDREQASRFVSGAIVIPRHERAELPEDRFYSDELQGMKVLSPEGIEIGMVKMLESEVPSPYLVIDSKEYGEVLVPFRKEFLESVNRESKSVKLIQPLSIHVSEG